MMETIILIEVLGYNGNKSATILGEFESILSIEHTIVCQGEAELTMASLTLTTVMK